MLASEVKSRPVYPGLAPDLCALSNIVVCDRAGAAAVIDMLGKAGAEFAARTIVLLSTDDYPDTQSVDVEMSRLQPARTEAVPNIDAAAAALGERLFRAQMGMRLYAAGSEPLIGSVVQRAMRFGDGETIFRMITEARHIRRDIIQAGQDTAAPNFGRNQIADSSKKS